MQPLCDYAFSSSFIATLAYRLNSDVDVFSMDTCVVHLRQTDTMTVAWLLAYIS